MTQTSDLTLDDCYYLLAKRIWTSGPSKIQAQYCLTPSDSIQNATTEFCRLSDYLYEQLKATHFDLTWIVQGQSVKVMLYAAEAFGACAVTDDQLVEEVHINL